MAGVERRHEFLAAEVTALRLEVGHAELLVEEEATDKITVSMTRSEENIEKYICELKDGVLEIETEETTVSITINRRNHSLRKEGTEKDILVITVPVGMKFNWLDVVMGAGNAQLANASTGYEDVKINVGAGKFLAGRIESAGKVWVNVGAGSVELADFKAKEAKLDCGAGSIRMNGAVEGDLKVNCGVGTVELRLDAVETDYNYKIDCAIGAVVINGSKRGGFFSSGSSVKYANALGTVKLECGVGRIELITRKRLTVE